MISKAKKVKDYKQLTKELPTLRYVDPEHVYINLQTARCKEYELRVSKGDHVKLGETLGERSGGFFKQPIYSTVSGYVQDQTTMIDSTGVEVECLTIRNDFKDELCTTIVDRPDSVIANMTQQDFVDVVKER